jgi:hypothetical protein
VFDSHKCSKAYQLYHLLPPHEEDLQEFPVVPIFVGPDFTMLKYYVDRHCKLIYHNLHTFLY